MPVSITANASARYAQASLVRQNDLVTKSTLRMSSGQRVLSAADDAAAMAIGTSLKVENSGLRSAMLNASSASSMLQIADGALGQISELMSRMQVLAVQASSGQYDDATRVLLDGEFQGIKAEVDRLANSTTFNDVPILAGTKKFDLTSAGTLGAAHGISNVRLDPLVLTSDRTLSYSYDATTENLTMSRVDGGATVTQTVNLTPLLDGSVGTGVNLQGNQHLEVGFSLIGTTLTLGAGFNRNTSIAMAPAVTDGGVMTADPTTFARAATGIPTSVMTDLTALGAAYSTTQGVLTLPLDASGAGGTVTLGAVPGISYKVGSNPLSVSGAASNDLVGTGTTVEVYADKADGSGRYLLGTLTTEDIAATGTGAGNLALNVGQGLIVAEEDTTAVAPAHLTYKVGTGVLTGQDTIGVDVPPMTLKALGIENLTIRDQFGAEEAMDKLKVALSVLYQGRAAVGAQQLRMEAVGRNLAVISENNEAARSGLIDVDVSKEITDLTTSQSMMQASIAMLSRANQMPDILLQLLKNG